MKRRSIINYGKGVRIMIKKVTIRVVARLRTMTTKLKHRYRILCLAVNFYEISKREGAGWTPRQCWSYAKTWIDGDFGTEWVEKRIRGEDI